MKRIVVAALLASSLGAAELKPQTVEAFDRYIRQTEQRLDGQKGFLWADESADRARRVRQGEIVVQRFASTPEADVPGGLAHDWVGSVFIPGVTLVKTLSAMQDYNHKEAYRPEVMASRILVRSGNDFVVYMRLLKKKVITVVLDTEHDIHYFQVGPGRWRSISRTTKIAQVEKLGKPDEYDLPPGTGDGFLWKLNTYWRFAERDGGTWVECEAISLTRDVPLGLGWIIKPIIRDLPKESLENTLRQTRDALSK
ncbi:MAG: hypothetical protein LAQ69_50730 [Acidobacteriia bacterium]|nr:hypothetical protein [Terriglobia bacterium]